MTPLILSLWDCRASLAMTLLHCDEIIEQEQLFSFPFEKRGQSLSSLIKGLEGTVPERKSRLSPF